MATLGVRARIAVFCANPCNVSILVGNPGAASPLVQVLCNSSIVGEYAVLTTVTLPMNGGWNVVELIVADAGITCIGKFLAAQGAWASLYPPGGSDPFSFAGAPSSGGGGPVLSPTGPG